MESASEPLNLAKVSSVPLLLNSTDWSILIFLTPLTFGAKTTPSALSSRTLSQNSGEHLPTWLGFDQGIALCISPHSAGYHLDGVPLVATTPWAGVRDPRSLTMQTSPVTELAELIFCGSAIWLRPELTGDKLLGTTG